MIRKVDIEKFAEEMKERCVFDVYGYEWRCCLYGKLCNFRDYTHSEVAGWIIGL